MIIIIFEDNVIFNTSLDFSIIYKNNNNIYYYLLSIFML